MNDSLTVFYTHRLRGTLALLPRLQTFLRRLRGEHAAGGTVLLVDLGEYCAPEVFPCALTGGRSSLIALDAMGYAAVNVEGALAEDDRAKLAEAYLQMRLVDSRHSLVLDGVALVVGRDGDADVVIDLQVADRTEWRGRTLRFGALETGQVGMARLAWRDGAAQLAADAIFTPPTETLPDPVIAGTIEFILGEARYTQKRRGA